MHRYHLRNLLVNKFLGIDTRTIVSDWRDVAKNLHQDYRDVLVEESDYKQWIFSYGSDDMIWHEDIGDHL